MKIICNTPGKGREENPYHPMDGLTAIDPKSKFWKWAEDHPELPAFEADETTPLQVGYIGEAELVWQYCALYDTDMKPLYNGWLVCDQEFADYQKSLGWDIRQAYIAPAPSAQPVNPNFTVNDFEQEITDVYGLDGSKDITLDEYYKLPEAEQELYVKVFYKNIGYNVAKDPIQWVPTTESDYNRHNASYRKVMYRPAQPVKAVEEEIEKINHKEMNNTPQSSALLLDKSDVQITYNFDKTFNLSIDLGRGNGIAATAIDEDEAEYIHKYLSQFFTKPSPHPIETPAIATSEGVEEAAERLYPYLAMPEDKSREIWYNREIDVRRYIFIAGASHILTTHVPVDEVEKIKSVLKQIRRVELLTPETEVLINKILNP